MQVRHIRDKNVKYDADMMKAMHALYWIAKEDIPLRKWHSVKELFSLVGVDLSPLRVGGNASYNSDQIII